jgi:hypothetical protein
MIPTSLPYEHLNAPIKGLETEDEPSTLADDSNTFVTDERSSDDGDSFDEEGELSLHEDASNDSEDDVPAEVELSYDNEDEAEEFEDEDASSEEEYETDYESEGVDDGNLAEVDDSSSCCSGSSFQSDSTRRHELFLPVDTSPTYQQLKYESEDEESDCDEEDMPPVSAFHRNPSNSFRPRHMRMPGKRLYERHPSPSNISISSTSSEDCSSIHSQTHEEAKLRTKRLGVTFDKTVSVYPIFETSSYTPSMIKSMYTNREELRINKLRNKREFAYDDHDWRNASEECDMDSNEDGDLVHPVHTAKRTFVRGPFLPSSTIWQPSGGAVVHRAKRMRMYYP